MRTATARLSLAAAGLAVLGLVGAAGAAAPVVGPSTLVVTDAAGDGLRQPGDDIVKLTYTTTGATKKVGTKTTYTPKALVVTLETASSIATNGTVQYDIEGALPGCGDFYFYITPGAALEGIYGSCGDDDAASFEGVETVVKDKTLTFTIGLGSVTGFKAGAAMSAISAYTGAVDPVTGELGAVAFGGTLSNDDVSSDATYKIG